MSKKIVNIINHLVHAVEYLIAFLSLAVLLFMIGYEVFKIFTVDGYLTTADAFLRDILTLVVGLEFVRMLINLTPANILEVLIIAIARQGIVEHSGYVGTIVCVLSVAVLFGIRKFLVSKKDLTSELAQDSTPEAPNTTEETE